MVTMIASRGVRKAWRFCRHEHGKTQRAWMI